MKNFSKLVLIIICAISMTASAKEGNHKPLGHRKAVKNELLAKYDANKDGRIDKSERASMSKQDKKRAHKAGLGKKHRHKHGKRK